MTTYIGTIKLTYSCSSNDNCSNCSSASLYPTKTYSPSDMTIVWNYGSPSQLPTNFNTLLSYVAANSNLSLLYSLDAVLTGSALRDKDNLVFDVIIKGSDNNYYVNYMYTKTITDSSLNIPNGTSVTANGNSSNGSQNVSDSNNIYQFCVSSTDDTHSSFTFPASGSGCNINTGTTCYETNCYGMKYNVFNYCGGDQGKTKLTTAGWDKLSVYPIAATVTPYYICPGSTGTPSYSCNELGNGCFCHQISNVNLVMTLTVYLTDSSGSGPSGAPGTSNAPGTNGNGATSGNSPAPYSSKKKLYIGIAIGVLVFILAIIILFFIIMIVRKKKNQ